MIHLIMVLSAIMLSSCSTREVSIGSPITHPSPTSSTSLQKTDEIKEKVFINGVGSETSYGELAETSISPQYPTAKKKTGYKIRGLHSSKPYVTKPFRSRKLLQQDINTARDDETPLQKMFVWESTSTQPLRGSGHQSPAKLTVEELASRKRETVIKNYTNILFDPENKENIGIKINATYNKANNISNKNLLHDTDEFVGTKISDTELTGHSEESEARNELIIAEIDRNITFANEEITTSGRDRVKRSTGDQNNERKSDRNISSHEEITEVDENNVSDDHVTVAEDDSQTDGDFPEAGVLTGAGNTTDAASTNSTASSRGQRRRRGRRRQHRQSKDLALWIDERQVKLFSGYIMEIFAIHDGRVLPYILDPNFEKHLPVIPFEVQSVNFTWQAGRKRYYYTFDRLHSHDENILQDPVVSLPTQGRIPRKPKVFTVNINCTGNASGIAAFDIGLLIQTRRGKPLPGTPLRLKLRKECTQPSPDPECDEKCENGGVCDAGRRCQCPEGYMGQYCKTALCYPQCMNGGTCTTPGRCTCPPGYQGRHCEGGICRDKCENGGKCIQKDTCACPRGYYGNRCEFSKCVIPCINGGRCRNVNKCRCPPGFAGDHCEIVTGRSLTSTAMARCSKKCRHGSCKGTTCQCQNGFTGRWCRRRGGNRKPVWL